MKGIYLLFLRKHYEFFEGFILSFVIFEFFAFSIFFWSPTQNWLDWFGVLATFVVGGAGIWIAKQQIGLIKQERKQSYRENVRKKLQYRLEQMRADYQALSKAVSYMIYHRGEDDYVGPAYAKGLENIHSAIDGLLYSFGEEARDELMRVFQDEILDKKPKTEEEADLAWRIFSSNAYLACIPKQRSIYQRLSKL